MKLFIRRSRETERGTGHQRSRRSFVVKQKKQYNIFFLKKKFLLCDCGSKKGYLKTTNVK